MDKKLYDLMDWAAVEELVYSEARDPHAALGPHVTEEGLLVQTLLPGALSVELIRKDGGKPVPMERMDEAGFYACLLPERERIPYRLRMTAEDGIVSEFDDAYAFEAGCDLAFCRRVAAGNETALWEQAGAHVTEQDGVSGTRFLVWAPNALRVSVVGDFNAWDGRRLQMKKIPDTGLFCLFVPGVTAGALYKYEIKTQKREILMKSDPFAFAAELRPGTASIVTAPSAYVWQDEAWAAKQAEDRKAEGSVPLSIYELHPGAWFGPEHGFVTWDSLADRLIPYLLETGFTHVQLMPVMEHLLDESLGYQVTGFFAPTARYGTPEAFRSFVDRLHGVGIGIILEWPADRFPKDACGLSIFDGTALYESGAEEGGMACFALGRAEVSNFLTANALYWLKEFHADGLSVSGMSRILYYPGGEGGIVNLYGGGENLDGVNFLRKLCRTVRKECPAALLLADGSAEWPMTTRDPKDDGLGFDFRRNTGWARSFLNYLSEDPANRGAHYGELTSPMLYQYSDSFLLPLSHAETAEGKGSLYQLPPVGSEEERFATVRAALAFFFLHPGKKLLFSGQEYGAKERWSFAAGLSREFTTEGQGPEREKTALAHDGVKTMTADLNALYRQNPALWKLDQEPAGFEWINCHSWQENVAVFLRHSGTEAEDLLVVANFAPIGYPKFNVGVPYYGTYREIFSTDAAEYGGSGMRNGRFLVAKSMEVDDRAEGIAIKLPPLSVLVFSCRRLARPAERVKKTALSVAESVPAPEEAVKLAGETAVKATKTAKERAGRATKTAKETAQKATKTAKETAVKAGKAAMNRAGKAGKTAKEMAEKAKKAALDRVNAPDDENVRR